MAGRSSIFDNANKGKKRKVTFTSEKIETPGFTPQKSFQTAPVTPVQKPSFSTLPTVNTPKPSTVSTPKVESNYETWMRSSKERMRDTAKQLTELENRRKKLEDDYLQTQVRFVESSNPEDLKQLRAIETEMDAVKVQLEDLEKLRPTYNARNAEKMYGDYEAEEKKVKEKHGSVEKLVADLDSRAAKLSEQEQRLKELEAQLKVNPSEHTYQTYLRTYDTYTRSVAEYQKLYADYEPVQRAWQDYDAYDKASKSDVGFGEGVKRVVNAGITQTGSLLASTLALPDKLLSKAMPGVSTPLADFAAWMKEGADRDAALVQEAVHGKKGWGQAANVGVAAVAAIPQMLAAWLSGGISTAATGATLATGAGAPVSMTTSLMNAAKQALKNPSYIASMASTLGSDFDEAKAAGATDIEALATAVIASSVNAGIEIGGGLEAVDDSLPLVQRILKSGREEGWEEVLQGIVSGTVNKGIYDFDKPIASLTDPDAILNPQRMAEEAFTGAAVGMLMTGIKEGIVAAANKLTGPRATHTRTDHNPVSPAAAPEVQRLTQQAEAVQAANPEATVLDAATTMYFDIAENKGKNTMKKAKLKAKVVNRLIEGKKVEDGEINALNLTDQNYREVFTKLTGVQFPDGKLQIEQLRSLARSAHTVAQQAKQVQAAPAAPVAPITQTDVAERVARAQQHVAQAVPETDNAITFEAFVEHAKQYPEYANAGAEVLEVAYAQFLQDSGMSVEMNGKPMSFAEFVGVLRSAPDGDKLTVGEAGIMFQQMAQRQNMTKEANYGGQNLLHSEGLSGQPDQRSRGQSRSVPETAGRAEGDGGTRRGDQAGSRAGRSGEVRSAGQNQEGTGSYRTVKVNDNPMTEVRPEAYTPEMQGLVDQYAAIGVNAHIVIEGYPIDAEGHYADGVTIFNTDGTIDVFLQVVGAHAMAERSDHEKAHVVLGRDPAAKEQAIAALGKAMSEKELLDLVNAYLPMYGSAYANSEDLIGDLLEEIICDAYANLNRANAGAPKYHDAVSDVIEAQLQSYSASYGQDVTLTDDAGNLVVESDGNGHSTFSMSTYQDSGRDILTQWMGKAVVNGDLTQQDADDIVNTLDLIYDICEEARGDYAPFDAWSEAKVVVNEQGNPVFSVVKANGDYAMNLDFSLVCKKRRTLDAVLNELVKQGFVDNLALNEKQIVKINDLIRSYGFEVACDLCFVDAKRYRQGKVADDFVKLYNDLVQSMIPKGSGLKPAYFNFGQNSLVDNADLGIHELPDDQLDFTKIEKVLKEKGEKSVEYKTAMLLKTSPADRKLTMRGDFLSTRGFDELNLKNPRVLKLFNSKKGSGGPKSAVSDVQYLNEVLTSKTFTPEKAYAVGGVRIQSFSDYVPRMVFDYVQMIADLAAKKLPAHAYTKEELFVMQFGLTGMKINMSLIPKVVDGGIAPGLDADGNYAWADESFNFDTAKKIQKAKGYSRNCGTIAVGVSDAHIRKLMADPEIRMVIPYHKSGLNPVVAKMNKIEAFVNYTDFQNTRRPNGKNGKKLDKDVAADKKLLSEMPDFNTKMRELGDPRAAAEFYVRWCEESNLLPKFDQFAYKTIDGMPVEKDGKRVVDENYYKLLEDFTVYDKGKYVEQTGLTMTFPTEDSAFGDMKSLIKRGLSEDALLEAKRDADVPKIVADIKQMKFSAARWKPNLDSAEWDIVKSVMNNGRGTNITSIDKMFFESTKGKSVFGIYSTDDDTLLYASRGEDAVREHQFVEFVKEEFENGGLTDTSTKGIRALAERARMQSVGNSGDNVAVGGSDRLGRHAGLDGRQPRFHASGALENVLTNILKAEESRRANRVTEQPTQASEESGASSLPKTKYSAIDSSGQLLTKEQDKYFEKSKARDYLGRLMPMFHGTRSFGFTVFDPQFSDDGISLFFTDRPSTSRTYTGTKENDIRALSKDTDMSKYEHDGEFGDNDEAWKYLEQSGYKRVVDAMTPDQVRGAFESVVEIDVEEAKTWLEALETELPKILNERRWTVAQNNSIRRLKDAIAEVEDLRGKPDYDSDLYFDVVHGAMKELFDAELAIMDNLEWYREDVRTVEGWDVLEGLSEAVSEPGYAKRHWDRLNDAYFEAVHYESPVHLVFSPTEGMFHLSDEALHSEARRVWRDNQRGLYEVYLNLENPLIIDANENNWNDLDYADLSDVEDNVYYYWEGDDTRSIAEWAKENGYDGVIFKNLYDHGRYRTGDESAATVMIAFKSEQVKSTANKHPTKDPDIRYSVIDANYAAAVERGDMETAERMVKRIADITGYTTEGYHGTYADFNEFKIGDVGYHIGTKAQAEDRIRDSRRFGTVPEKDARILHLFARLSNPVYAATDFGDWHGKYAASMLLETDQWEEGYDENAEEINKRLAEIAEMPDNADTDKALREFLQSLGYDGIVYENRFEGRGESWEDPKASYIVFDSSQLKLADPVTYDDNGNVIPLSERFQTNNPDIRYSVLPNLTFEEQVDRVAAGTLDESLAGGDNRFGAQHSAVYVRNAPTRMMIDLGYGNLAVLTTQDHVTSGMAQREDADGNIVNIHAHQLTPEQIKKVPEILQRPVMVMQAKGRPESMVFVSDELDYAGRPIIVAVKANGTDIVYDGKLGPAHLITSFYGRNGFESFVRTAVNEGRIAYYDPAKLDSLLEKLPENKGRSNSSPTTPGYHSSGQLMSGIAPEQILMKVQPKVKNPGQRKYSVTPQFEKWYKETYGEDLTSSQLKRRLQTAERRAEEAEHDRKAAELKNTIDSQMNLTAWMMHHTKKMREQKRTMNEKLAEARKEKTAAVRAAVAETKEIERAKAEVQHDADRMAERRAAAKRLRTREDAYKQKVTEMKENHKLKRNAAKATLRDKRLLDKKRAEIETEQGPIETLRRDPKERARIKNLQEAAQALRIKGRSLYAIFLSEAAEIERFGRRQTSEVRADELVTILGSCNSTTERIFKKGLFDRGGNRIGDSMSDVFLCWDEAHKKVNEGMQDLLNVFMLNRVTVDRMTIESRAEEALVAFENEHEWLRDMDQKEFARLVAMTETEAEKLGKQEARELAIEYHRRIQRRLRAKNKSVYGDKNGKPVTAESAQAICDKLLAENPWLEEKSQGIYEWWDLFMRTWAVGDTISETEYAMMRSDYPHYVPTYHISHDSVGGAGFVGNGAASVSKAVKKAVGSTKPLSDIHNIEDSFSKLVSKIVRLNRLNEMYMNIIDTAMLDEDGTFADMAYFDWDWQDGAYANALITGSADIADLTDTVEETEKAGLEKVGDDYKLTAWRNGRKYTAYLSESLYKSIGDVTGHLTSEAEEIILKVGNTLTGPMKQAITGLNPIFGLRNAVRDFSTAIVNSTSGLAFPKYYAMAWNEIRKGSDRWEQFQALGGTHANYYNNENGFAGTMSQKDNPVKKVFGGLEAFNNAIEAATRFAEYLATVERRGDTYENRLKGIKNAAEVTVDFSRKGKLGKHINAYIPYWNPAVQGLDRLVRSVIDSPDGSAVWKQATMTLGRASMSVVMCEAIQYAVLHALDRDDEWEELNDRTKDTYYCIPLPKSKTFLKIPKNREWGTIIGTPFMRMLEYANGRENPFENYIETALIPNFLPPGVTDIIGISQYIDLATNKDFAGRTIVPYNLQQGTKGYQYDSDTSMFSRLLGQMFVEKISPMQVDYIIQDYLGDFGEMFIMATSEATLTGDQNPIKTAWDILTSPLMADARYSNYAVNKYYDTLEGLDRVVQDRKNQLGTDEAKKTIEYQTQKALNELYGKAITELNREVREMPDGEEKDILKAQIADLAKEAVEFYEDSMAGKINNPIRTAEYHDFSETVSKELIRMDAFSGDYKFVPYDVPKSKYNDPDDEKNREYILTDEQKAYFKQLYREKYNEIFENLIRSSKYKKKKDSEKAGLLEDARDDVLDATKEEFFEWLDDTGVRSTKKKK